MLRNLLVIGTLGTLCSWVFLAYSWDNPIVDVWVSCEWTVVTRTSVGKLEVSRTDPNSPGCRGPKVDVPPLHSDSVTQTEQEDQENMWLEFEEMNDFMTEQDTREPVEGVILLDLAQTDIVNYRLERMRQNQIRYANAIRSVRMRQAASKESKTKAILMRNDAVIVESTGGWSQVQGVMIDAVSGWENDIIADTTGKADGYVATKYLRDANPSDLVRIRQADNAYWSDVATVNADLYLNVRAHPWHTAPIVTTIGRGTLLYVVSNVDDWSEVISDDRSIRGYVKSKYLTIEKYQRVEQSPLLK